MKPLVSLVIPVYNTEKYIMDCVKSAVAQTYENIEVILVDDGSPDNCPQICDQLAQTYGNVSVIHKSNGGLSTARNAGIENLRIESYYNGDPTDENHADIAITIKYAKNIFVRDITSKYFYFGLVQANRRTKKINE